MILKKNRGTPIIFISPKLMTPLFKLSINQPPFTPPKRLKTATTDVFTKKEGSRRNISCRFSRNFSFYFVKFRIAKFCHDTYLRLFVASTGKLRIDIGNISDPDGSGSSSGPDAHTGGMNRSGSMHQQCTLFFMLTFVKILQ
jgi:hypothetical protein